jgi:Lon protease-like protein
MTTQRISIFPLTGAIIFPSMQLPLHIFEPRYRDLVSDSLARDRKIGMIQPKGQGNQPPLFNVGCLARIHEIGSGMNRAGRSGAVASPPRSAR